jgi:hypothetical protein
VIVDAPGPALAVEVGRHFICHRRSLSLRLGDAPWIEELSLDGVTLKVPIDMVLAWSFPRGQPGQALLVFKR